MQSELSIVVVEDPAMKTSGEASGSDVVSRRYSGREWKVFKFFCDSTYGSMGVYSLAKVVQVVTRDSYWGLLAGGVTAAGITTHWCCANKKRERCYIILNSTVISLGLYGLSLDAIYKTGGCFTDCVSVLFGGPFDQSEFYLQQYQVYSPKPLFCNPKPEEPQHTVQQVRDRKYRNNFYSSRGKNRFISRGFFLRGIPLILSSKSLSI